MNIRKNFFIKIVVGLFVLIIAYITTIQPTISFIGQRNLLSTGTMTTAQIIKYEKTSEKLRGHIFYTYTPILEFNLDGKSIVSNDDYNSFSKILFKVNSTVNIKYNPSNPTNTSIANTSFIINKINEVASIYSIPILLLSLYSLSFLSKKNSKNQLVFSLNVSLRKKLISCLLAIGLPTYSGILLSGQYLSMKTYNQFSSLKIIWAIILILIYFILVFSTIKTALKPKERYY